MFSRLREHFGTAGLLVAIIALVAALSGAAIAANGGSSDGKATASAKAKKGPRGPKGPAGPPGPAGPAGPQGPKGDKGDTGAAGSNGTNGTNGTNGISPTGTSFTGAKGGCTEGGVEFKGANTTFACNGGKGANGLDGLAKTLPAGATVSGAWASTPGVNTDNIVFSFTIPLADEFIPTFNFIRSDGTAQAGNAANCPGTAEVPAALPGNLCVYRDPIFTAGEITGLEPFVKSSSGFVVNMNFSANTLAMGTWAVTAPNP